MFLEQPVFPDTLAFGATGGPRWQTLVTPSPGRAEQRSEQWTRPLGMWEFGLRNRSDAETRELLAFFRIMRGRAHGFRFKDFGAGESSAIDALIGVGTGSSEDYQLVKPYVLGSLTYSRTIRKPIAGTVLIKVNGVPTTSFSVDTTTGIVTMTATAGHAITATCEFHVPCRFDTDWCPVRRVEPNAYDWSGVRLLELAA